MLIYEEKNCLKLFNKSNLKYILFDWESFSISLEGIKKAHQVALDNLLKNGYKTYVAETSRVKTALSQDILTWWEKEWIPKLDKNGLKLVVTVLPTTALANLSTKSWQKPVEIGNIHSKNVLSLEEAEEYIRHYWANNE